MKEIEFLKKEYPNSEVFKSLEKDYIIVQTVLCSSIFYRDDKSKFTIPITSEIKYHIDTVRLKMINELKPESKPVEEPVLVGKLNRVFGYVGFEKIEIGTDVFGFRDYYFFEMAPLKGGMKIIQKFYKETLKPCIDFI